MPVVSTHFANDSFATLLKDGTAATSAPAPATASTTKKSGTSKRSSKSKQMAAAAASAAETAAPSDPSSASIVSSSKDAASHSSSNDASLVQLSQSATVSNPPTPTTKAPFNSSSAATSTSSKVTSISKTISGSAVVGAVDKVAPKFKVRGLSSSAPTTTPPIPNQHPGVSSAQSKLAQSTYAAAMNSVAAAGGGVQEEAGIRKAARSGSAEMMLPPTLTHARFPRSTPTPAIVQYSTVEGGDDDDVFRAPQTSQSSARRDGNDQQQQQQQQHQQRHRKQHQQHQQYQHQGQGQMQDLDDPQQLHSDPSRHAAVYQEGGRFDQHQEQGEVGREVGHVMMQQSQEQRDQLDTELQLLSDDTAMFHDDFQGGTRQSQLRSKRRGGEDGLAEVGDGNVGDEVDEMQRKKQRRSLDQGYESQTQGYQTDESNMMYEVDADNAYQPLIDGLREDYGDQSLDQRQYQHQEYQHHHQYQQQQQQDDDDYQPILLSASERFLGPQPHLQEAAALTSRYQIKIEEGQDEVDHAQQSDAIDWTTCSEEEWIKGGEKLKERLDQCFKRVGQLMSRKASRMSTYESALAAHSEELATRQHNIDSTFASLRSWAGEIWRGKS